MNYHLIGIGGIGMSALARLLKAEGNHVSGSDSSESELILELKGEGIEVFLGHDKAHIHDNIDLVVYSEAIPESNIELVEAKKRNVRVQTYFEALGEWSKDKNTIAVAGTHGKTTTTAMLAQIFIDAGLDPSVVVGSKCNKLGGKNMRLGKGDIFIVEACEYRKSFHYLHPSYVVLTNCEPDHLDYYENDENYFEAFAHFLSLVPGEGRIVCDMSDEGVSRVVESSSAGILDVAASKLIDTIDLRVPGEYNRQNALCAQEMARQFDIDDGTIASSLNDFEGTWRRFEIKGNYNGALIIDDYGHHPREVSVTLAAASHKYPKKRIICVFQPHQYSRTRVLLDGFAKAFRDADMVIIPNIYEARDSLEDKEAVSAELLVDEIKKHHDGEVIHGDGIDNTVNVLKEMVTEDDVVLVMGAGDVYKVSESLLCP